MLPLQVIKYKCNNCDKIIDDVTVFAEQVQLVLKEGFAKSLDFNGSMKLLTHGHSVCPHCESDELEISLGEYQVREDSLPSISYAGSKTFRQTVPDGFKDVLNRVKDNIAGAKEMRSSVL